MANQMSKAFSEIAFNNTIKEWFGDFKIFREAVPTSISESENIEDYLPIGCLYDIENVEGGYASNRSTVTHSMLQFSIWAEDFEQLDEIDTILREVMPVMGYTNTFSHSTIDPDINIPYLVNRYRYSKSHT